jgi:hypothetical protein
MIIIILFIEIIYWGSVHQLSHSLISLKSYYKNKINKREVASMLS